MKKDDLRRETARFAAALAALLKLGVPAADALARIQKKASPFMVRILKDMERDLRAGASLKDAFRLRNDLLPGYFLSALQKARTNEETVAAIEEVSNLLEASERRRQGFSMALIYPRFVIITFMIVFWILFGWAGRMFAGLFQGMGSILPLPTKVMIALVAIASKPVTFLVYILLFIAVILVFSSWERTDPIRIRVPLFGALSLRQDAATWCTWLDCYMGNAVPLPEAIKLASQTCISPTFKAGMDEVAELVKRGGRLSEGLNKMPIFPHLGAHLAKLAEEMEFPPGRMAKIGTMLQREFDLLLHYGLSALGPFIVVSVGLLVVFVVIAYFLPLYLLIGTLH